MPEPWAGDLRELAFGCYQVVQSSRATKGCQEVLISRRLENKVALLFGAGQVECEHDIWGNGRATAARNLLNHKRLYLHDSQRRALSARV